MCLTHKYQASRHANHHANISCVVYLMYDVFVNHGAKLRFNEIRARLKAFTTGPSVESSRVVEKMSTA